MNKNKSSVNIFVQFSLFCSRTVNVESHERQLYLKILKNLTPAN